MVENDYNHEEIESVCSELLNVFRNKLKIEELNFVQQCYYNNFNETITQEERDTLMKLYDAIGEAGY